MVELGMILLVVNGKEKYYPNKEGIKILRKSNPKEKFRIAICKHTKKEVIQMYDPQDLDNSGWLCLHD